MRKCTNIFTIYEVVVIVINDFAPSIPLNFLIYEENFLFFFISVAVIRATPYILSPKWI
jgi:hypothetical protein